VQTLIYQFVVLTKINRLTLKRFEQKYLLLSGFTFEVVEISPANILYSIQCMNETLYRWTFNFHKVMRQQNSSAVEDFILPYSTVYLRIQKWKKYWNRSTFAKVIVKIKVARFLWPTVYISSAFATVALSFVVVAMFASFPSSFRNKSLRYQLKILGQSEYSSSWCAPLRATGCHLSYDPSCSVTCHPTQRKWIQYIPP